MVPYSYRVFYGCYRRSSSPELSVTVSVDNISQSALLLLEASAVLLCDDFYVLGGVIT